MIPIEQKEVQKAIDSFAKKDVYLHLETTNGAYASHHDESFFSAGAYIRNAFLQYEHGKIIGEGPYRAGLKLAIGWVYAEGLTHYEIDNEGRLLLAGLDFTGKLAVSLQVSESPFE
ncbi:YojF family protein [Bacillus massiliglaciei]|uniref:YojF family protein n=1 Tax=Bacillus massiliglaciei TaxID=1816693 RepID=UPI000DA61BAA|nr:YojF family protein [Bacillus massiliglaciei]